MDKRHTILVVDDEVDVVKSVQDLLRYDYQVLGATRSRQALELMGQQPVHVVMSDQRMPEMSGVEFLRQVRRDFPDAVRLLFTGYADIRAVIEAINEGHVYRYITKPWDPDELQAIIRQAADRYDLQAERRRLMAELQAKNAELERANAALKESDALKTAFIQVASHELRTPVAILQGLSDLASRVKSPPPPLSTYVEQIRRATGRLAHLVNQLVMMLSAGQYDRRLARQDTDLAALLGEAMDDVRVFMEQRRQNAVRDWTGDLGSLPIEREKIRHALNHLLLNAIKFTPDGGTITLSGAREPDGQVRLSVSDTGVGMDEATTRRLGEAFFTGFDVKTHSSGQFEFNRRGLGLGLSVARAFVDMHGGTMEVRSAVGQGTTVVIRLPAR